MPFFEYFKNMKYLTYTLWIIFLASSLVFSRPAKPGVISVKQSDSSSLSIREFGDEHYHYTTTEDDYLIVKNEKGIYVYVDENGSPSKIEAKNKEKRTANENTFLKGIDQKKVKAKHKSKRPSSYPQQDRKLNFNRQSRSIDVSTTVPQLLKRPTAKLWTAGERYIPVLLVSTLDKAAGDSALFHRFLNEPGFSEQGNIGSLRDYFLISSDSLFKPHFDVFPIQLNKKLTDYVNGGDFLEGQFIKEAIDLMVQKPYFSGSKYCLSETTVDGFLFLFPGKEEDALKIHEDFWGHQYWMEWNGSTFNYKPYQAGGFSFNTYAFLAQKEDGNESNLNELGILAHEFSHVMGLSDLYAYDSNNNIISGPSPWDVMTQGMYNSNGRKPPKYSAFERESMGWLTLTELSASDEIYSLMLLDKMEAYSVTNPKNNNEYYVIEYRPSTGFDSGINNTGVLVWYIDYDSNVWDNNNPNDDPSHQRVAVKEVLLGTQSSKTSYSPFTFYDDSSSTVPGIFSFIKGTGDKVCFTTNKNKMGFVCEESSSSVIASSSSVEESSSSATVLIENHLRKSNFKIAVLGRNLQVYLPIVGEKVLKVMDVQGNLVHLGRFTGDNETLTLQNKGVYYLQISLNNELLVSRPVKIR